MVVGDGSRVPTSVCAPRWRRDRRPRLCSTAPVALTLLLLLVVTAVFVTPDGVAAESRPRPTSTPRLTWKRKCDCRRRADCFPAAATVVTAAGVVTRMDALTVGTAIVTGPDGSTSPVIAFSHADPTGTARTWVTLTTVAGDLTLTAGHYVPVRQRGGAAAGAPSRLVAAANIVVGDAVRHVPPPPLLASVAATAAAAAAAANRSTCAVGGAPAAGPGWVVVTRTRVTAAGGRRGLYNPHTADGWLVVDGVLTSTYTTAVAPAVADAALAVARAAYRWGAGAAVGGRLLPALGGMSVPRWMRGSAVY